MWFNVCYNYNYYIWNENWNKFQTQRLGLRWYLSSYSENKIRLFTSLGLEYVFENEDISSDDPAINSYGLVGVEFDASNYISISFSMGTGGKGLIADKLEDKPNYAHGFISIIAVELNL